MNFLKNVKSRILGDKIPSPGDLTIQQADVGDELAAAGKAFGTLMEQVGLAVASTQQQLDKNGAHIAELMCATDVEMIRARETIYRDDGKIDEIIIVTGTGKLIELASPVFYEHKFVALQGEFTAKELAASTQSKVKQSGASGNAGTGPASTLVNRKFGKKKAALSGGGQSVSASTSFSDVTIGSTFDSSVGTMRMNALIAPKDSIGIPKPPFILVGPRIAINQAGAPVADSTGRTLDITITVKKMDGVTANDGQALAIDTDGMDWETIPAGQNLTTDSAGELKIKLKRTQTPSAPPLESKQAAVTVRLGLVTATAAVTV